MRTRFVGVFHIPLLLEFEVHSGVGILRAVEQNCVVSTWDLGDHLDFGRNRNRPALRHLVV